MNAQLQALNNVPTETLIPALERALQDQASEAERAELEQHLHAVQHFLREHPDHWRTAGAPPSVEPPSVLGRLELACLSALALGLPLALTLPAGRERAGYLLVEDGPSSTVCVFPALAAHLASGEAWTQRWALEHPDSPHRDLWEVDLEVWQALKRQALKEAALLWVHSAGRRLLQRVDAELPLEGLLRAAGWSPLPVASSAPGAWQWTSEASTQPEAWRWLHAAAPTPEAAGLREHAVSSQSSWPDTEYLIGLLGASSSPSERSLALECLLKRAVVDPAYTLEGMQRKLPEDLSLHLATAHAVREARGSDVDVQLEALCIRLAGRWLDPHAQSGLELWGLSRWLLRLLPLSPYADGALEPLLVRLQTLTAHVGDPADTSAPLAPHRFRTGPDKLELEDLAFLTGVFLHYRQTKPLLPMPLSLLQRLREVAKRTPTAQEEAGEQALRGLGAQPVGWPPHIASPWLARWQLSKLELTWLSSLDEQTLHGCIEALETDPEHFYWLAQAFQVEPSKRSAPVLEHLKRCWRALRESLTQRGGDSPGCPRRLALLFLLPLCLEEARPDDLAGLTDLDQDASRWLPHLLDVNLKSAQQTRHWDVWRVLAKMLLHALSAAQTPLTLKESLAKKALLRITGVNPASGGAPEAGELKEIQLTLFGVLLGKPYSEMPAIAREMRRQLGVA